MFLILGLAVFLVILFVRAFQRRDPPRHHHWPEGLDAGDSSTPPRTGPSGQDGPGAGNGNGNRGAG
jgi:hypothetical protein